MTEQEQPYHGNAQAGIFALGTSAHAYLEFDRRDGTSQEALILAAADLPEPRSTIGGVNLVLGFRPSLWRTFGQPLAPDAADFDVPVCGPEDYCMPATQHDLAVWMAGASLDVIFDAGRRVLKRLSTVATLAQEVTSWAYHGTRDLTGFVDGSANPTLLEAPGVALVPPGQPGAGGSVLLLQKWLHKAQQWDALAIKAQERIIGRTKDESIELSPETRGPASHVSRTDFKVDGQKQEIFRRNTPFGTISSFGTMFVGFSCQQLRLERQLKRMAGTDDGIRDALTYYSTPVSGAYYWVPAIEAIAKFAPPSEED